MNSRSSRHIDFPFPLNIYAHLLVLETGRLDDLHYGLFQDPDEGVAVAQRRATELLLAHLPPPPARLLEVGIGSGRLLYELMSLGYEVEGITPDPVQIDLAVARGVPLEKLHHLRFEAFEGDTSCFDVVLFHESGQYINPLSLFERAERLLRPEGHLLLLDEVALARDADAPGGLHWLDHLRVLAGRFGLDRVLEQDCSKQARLTLDYLLDALSRYRERLIGDLDLSDEDFERLIDSNRRYREQYAQGRYGYVLFDFKKQRPPLWRVAHVNEYTAPQMRALFQRVFDHPMSASMWQWKYGDGRGMAVGVWRDERLVAHYGGVVRDVVWRGQSLRALQVGDVMVAPEERGTLTRKGPFFLAASTFLEQNMGYATPHLLGFGFPNRRAMDLAQRLGLYGEVGQVLQVRWSTRLGTLQPGTIAHEISPCQVDLVPHINRLWGAMRRDLRDAIVGIRDAAYLRRRYGEHPERSYTVWLISRRLTHRPLGLLVMCQEGESMELLDVIAPLRRVPLLIAHARRLAARAGARELTAWISDSFAHRFKVGGGRVVPTEISIPANIWSPGPPTDMLKGRWWLTSGDTDFR